jgi:hypothetical protein
MCRTLPVFIGIALLAGCSVSLSWEQETSTIKAIKQKIVFNTDRIAYLLIIRIQN